MLSGSTRRACRAEARLIEGEKRDAFLTLSSLRVLLLVEQHETRVNADSCGQASSSPEATTVRGAKRVVASSRTLSGPTLRGDGVQAGEGCGTLSM